MPIKTVEVRVTARIRSIELGGGLPGPIGISITGGTVNGSGHLILTLSNSATIDAGYIVGPPGPISSLTETGNGIIIDNTNPSDPVLSLDATLEAIANFATGANKVMVWSGTDTLTSFDVDTDVTLAANSDTRFATQKAVKAYADALIAANDAMVFKGTIDASANPNYPAADRGHTWRISVAGKIGGASGVNVEVGDLIICLTDGSAAGTQAAVGANWTISQTNLDGAVIGPASSTSGNLAVYSNTTGKLIGEIAPILLPISTATQAALDTLDDDKLDSTALTGAAIEPSDADYVLGRNSSGFIRMPVASLKDVREFRVIDYVLDASETTATKIVNFDSTQDEDVVLTACRAAGDAALAFLQGGSGRSAKIVFPAGLIVLKNEFFSDSFQSAWWSQTSLGKGKSLIIEGAGIGATTIKISSSYAGSVRNTAKGNQRAYGPWSGQASPSILFANVADTRTVAAPAAMFLRSFRCEGTGSDGRDPIPYWGANELMAFHEDCYFSNFRNHGQIINGSYNSQYSNIHFENCGLQPVESGAIMGYKPGFPPPWVVFDYTVAGSTLTVTAKAGAAYGGYSIGDNVPYFYNRHVGLTFYMGGAHVVSAVGQAGPATIATVGGDGHHSATMTLPAGVTGPASKTGAAGSFGPVKFTSTAGSDLVTLSAGVRWGTDENDMIGHVVSLVKAGANGHASDTARYQTRDVLVSRIEDCTVGNASDGYTTIQLVEPARLSTTDYLLTGQGFMSCPEETYVTLLGSSAFSLNDTDFIYCSWEFSSGYNDNPHTGSCQLMVGDTTGSAAFESCKVHGADSVRGNWASDAQFIFDNCKGGEWNGSTFTHSAMMAKGQVRLMGKNMVWRFNGGEIGSWQLPTDFSAFYADPPNTWTWWDVSINGYVGCSVNQAFPTGDGKRKLIGSSQSGYTLAGLVRDNTTIYQMPGVSELTSSDNLDNVIRGGMYFWYTAPSNAPTFGNNSVMMVIKDPVSTIIEQIVWDTDNHRHWHRTRLSGTWGTWYTPSVRSQSAAEIAAAVNAINTVGKRAGTLAYDTTNHRLMVADGSSATSAWYVADGSASVTPA